MTTVNKNYQYKSRLDTDVKEMNVYILVEGPKIYIGIKAFNGKGIKASTDKGLELRE